MHYICYNHKRYKRQGGEWKQLTECPYDFLTKQGQKGITVTSCDVCREQKKQLKGVSYE